MMGSFEESGLAADAAAVLDGAADGFLLVDESGQVRGWNAALAAIAGLRAEEVGSATLASVDALLLPVGAEDHPPQLPQPPAHAAPQLVASAEGRLFERSMHAIHLAGGEQAWLVAYRPMDVVRQGSSVRAEDIDARIEKRRHALRMESVGRLAGGIAHDFNNMLTAMLGYAEMLEREVGPRDSLRHVLHAARSAADLTRQLLAFSRMQRLEPRVVDVSTVVTSLGGMVGRLIGDDVHVEIDAPGGLPPVCADPTQLEQIVMNLVLNARDAMKKGGHLTITVRHNVLERPRPGREVQPAGQYLQIEVSDTGHGIPPEIITKVFEPFFTTKGMQGTGLGLSTVYGIVKQSGGFIWVDSQLGVGTTFTIDLPVAALETQGVLNLEPPVERNPQAVKRILVVEDQESVRLLTCEMLESDGFDVVSAAEPAEGLRLALDAGQGVDLVLTDVTMPGMTGAELAGAIRDARPELPVLFMSGLPKALEWEAPGPILSKPFTRSELLAHVRARAASRAA